MVIRLQIWGSGPPKPIVQCTSHLGNKEKETTQDRWWPLTFEIGPVQRRMDRSNFCRRCFSTSRPTAGTDAEKLYVPTRRNYIQSPLLGSDSFGRSVTQDAHNIATAVRVEFQGCDCFSPSSSAERRNPRGERQMLRVQFVFCLLGTHPSTGIHIRGGFGLPTGRFDLMFPISRV